MLLAAACSQHKWLSSASGTPATDAGTFAPTEGHAYWRHCMPNEKSQMPDLAVAVPIKIAAHCVERMLQPLRSVLKQPPDSNLQRLRHLERGHLLHVGATLRAQPEGAGILPILLRLPADMGSSMYACPVPRLAQEADIVLG